MRIFEITGSQVDEHTGLAPLAVPGGCRTGSYVWLSLTRDELRESLADVQGTLHALCGTSLVDLHVADLLNEQLPSHYDYTSLYDVLVFRQLAGRPADEAGPADLDTEPMLRQVDTRPVGFAVFDRVLLSVHPLDAVMRDGYAARLIAAGTVAQGAEGAQGVEGSRGAPTLDARAVTSRVPAGPADLMLRIVNHIVDGYLDLRRELTGQLDHWQAALTDPRSRFTNWSQLMTARQALRHLDGVCDDQREAIQDWIDAQETLPPADTPVALRECELLMVRSRDVLEHIERVIHHVRRLEQNAETAVQMHFSIQGHRTNDIMRVLTVLTAIFLPLNLIAGIFGMNFEFIPLVHKADGFWLAMASMVVVALVLVAVFWRKRYLTRTAR